MIFSLKMGAKIVVVDDEPNVLRTLTTILQEQGYVVIPFENPLLALRYLKDEQVDIILSDLKMPEMDGIQFLQQVKKSHPSIPVILVTAFATVDSAVRAFQYKAFDYLRKPLEIRKICEVIERALDSSK